MSPKVVVASYLAIQLFATGQREFSKYRIREEIKMTDSREVEKFLRMGRAEVRDGRYILHFGGFVDMARPENQQDYILIRKLPLRGGINQKAVFLHILMVVAQASTASTIGFKTLYDRGAFSQRMMKIRDFSGMHRLIRRAFDALKSERIISTWSYSPPPKWDEEDKGKGLGGVFHYLPKCCGVEMENVAECCGVEMENVAK